MVALPISWNQFASSILVLDLTTLSLSLCTQPLLPECVCVGVFILLNLCWHTNINRHKVAIIILEPMSTEVY